MIKVKNACVALALGLGLTLISLVLFGGTDSLAVHAIVAGDSPDPRSMPSLSALDPTPPTLPVRLIFIHHSTGENWLRDDNGGLGIALRDNNYFVSDTNYGWGPPDQEYGSGTIGDHTDIPHWYSWFSSPHRDTYLAALYAETDQHSTYSRLATNPGGPNTIIMFKSCFPNSNLDGNPDDPPAASADNYSPLDVAHAKRIYLDLLTYFATRQDKLFVVITAPPLASWETDAAKAANARAFNNWLVNDWLIGYPYNNVAVFDFYNVLTSNGGSTRINDPDTNDLGQTDGNHHRWWNANVQHLQTVDHNYSAYWTSDSHPSQAGNQKATAEFVPLLNTFYHQWKGNTTAPDLSASSKTVSSLFATSGDRITYTVVIRSTTGPLSNTVLLTDTIPNGLSYFPETLTATVGTVNDSAAPILRWSGLLTPTAVVTVTYAVTVSTTASEAITNSAVIVASGYQPITRSAGVFINGYKVYLPLVMSNHTSK